MAAHRIAKTDRRIAPGIYRSQQSVTGYPGHIPYGDRAERIVKHALPILKEMLDLPSNLEVRLASIKGRVRGWWINGEKLAIVDYMATGRQVLESLCHELVHAEQYKQGRLDDVLVDGKWVALWFGTPVDKAYAERPFEIEAFGRQVELADSVIDKLEEKHPGIWELITKVKQN